MPNILFLILRRMRPPLLVLIAFYSIAVLGMVLIPGRDEAGLPWHMDFFHAFYFVSYMGTTIGFGEIPHAFTPAQRFWVLLCTYMTVVAWIYAIGNLLALLQDSAFRQVLRERRFADSVRRIKEPFYLLCGYGDMGAALVEMLTRQHRRVVVVDIDPERINDLSLADLRVYVPGLQADAALPKILEEAGLRNPWCRSVVALTHQGQVNLHIAITSKLLNPRLMVICRAESKEIAANMDSFGTDHIIDPFDTFADYLHTALQAPYQGLLYQWLAGSGDLDAPLQAPSGTWILCGYGRFGKALHKRLVQQDIPVVMIEATPDRTGWPEEDTRCIRGRGTEAVTLEAAKVSEAVGIVAGTDNDTNNLSILMTARDLNPDLFMVARQNRQSNHALFEAIQADLVTRASHAMAVRVHGLLSTPLLQDFMAIARHHPDTWSRQLVVRMGSILGEAVPSLWEITISTDGASAVVQALRCRQQAVVGDLIRDPMDRYRKLVCFSLLLVREKQSIALPTDNCALAIGDRLLFCGLPKAISPMHRSVHSSQTFGYVRTGQVAAQSYFWQWLERRRLVSSNLVDARKNLSINTGKLNDH